MRTNAMKFNGPLKNSTIIIEPTQETFSPLRPLPKYSGVGPTNQYNDKYDN